MAFCGQCGAPLDGGKFCPQCGAPVEPEASGPQIAGGKSTSNPWVKFIASLAVVALVIFGIVTISTTSSEPCDWCHGTPTKAYKMSDGSKSYVCADCRKTCAWCGAKATKHYENLLNMMVFVCNDCYNDIVN